MPRSNHLDRILGHIESRLDEDLRGSALAQAASLSRHQFHRSFVSRYGLGAGRYVRLLRLKRAALRLAFRPCDSITLIALDAGFEAPESFARAFRREFGRSPTAFRARPDWPAWERRLEPLRLLRRQGMIAVTRPGEVRIIHLPATQVMVMSHRGNPARLLETIGRFVDWRRTQGLPPRTHATYNILYGDPDRVPPEDFRLDLAVAANRPADSAAGVERGVIPAGRCAVLRYVGSDDGLAEAFAMLLGEWLPASGELPADRPAFLRRIVFFPDVSEHEAVTDIHLPLA